MACEEWAKLKWLASAGVLSFKFRCNQQNSVTSAFFTGWGHAHTHTLTLLKGAWPFPLLQWEARLWSISLHSSTTIPSAHSQAWTHKATPSSAHLHPHAQAMTQLPDNGRISKCFGVSMKVPTIVCQLWPWGEQRMLEGLRMCWLQFLIQRFA